MHGDNTSRNFPQQYSRVSQSFAILQNFTSIYQLEVVNRLRTILFFCTHAQNSSSQIPSSSQNSAIPKRLLVSEKNSEVVPFYPPLGQWLRILSLMLATVVAGAYLLGPMSVPSYKRNFSSTGSSNDITDMPSSPPTSVCLSLVQNYCEASRPTPRLNS